MSGQRSVGRTGWGGGAGLAGGGNVTGPIKFLDDVQLQFGDDIDFSTFYNAATNDLKFLANTGGDFRFASNMAIGADFAPTVPLDVRVSGSDGIRLSDGTDELLIEYDAANNRFEFLKDDPDTNQIWFQGSALGTGAIIFSDSDVNAVDKAFRLANFPRLMAQSPVAMLTGLNTLTKNELNVGGGSASHQALNEIGFFTSAVVNTPTGTERMTIIANGNVGLGITIPEEVLHVVGNTKITGDIFLSSSQKLYLDGGSNTYISQVAADEINFVTGGSERARVNNTGFGINETSPAQQLHVKGSSLVTVSTNHLMTAGGAIAVGDMVVPSTTADNKVIKNTVEDALEIIGVALTSAAGDGSTLQVTTDGEFEVSVAGSVSRRNWLSASSTAGKAKNKGSNGQGVCLMAMESGTDTIVKARRPIAENF